jgi:hypothetical protein
VSLDTPGSNSPVSMFLSDWGCDCLLGIYTMCPSAAYLYVAIVHRIDSLAS